MADDEVLYYCYLVLLLITLISGCYRYRVLDRPAIIFFLFLSTTVLCEYIALYASLKYKNNLPVYAIYSLVEFVMVSLYFNSVIDIFKKRNTGIYIAALGVVAGIYNLVFIQGLNTINSYFMIFEGLSIISMGLFFFFRILLHNDKLRIHMYPHFWFASILTFFWGVSFLNWSLYDYFAKVHPDEIWVINYCIVIVNLVTYSAISCVFILYPKMQKTYER